MPIMSEEAALEAMENGVTGFDEDEMRKFALWRAGLGEA